MAQSARQPAFADLVVRAWRAVMGVMPVADLAASLRELGPYAAMGLLVPGGSLIALCVWLLRHRTWTAIHGRRILIMAAALSGLLIFPSGV